MLRTRALEIFLAGIEARAFRIASSALANEADALDAVQEAMIRLARRYGKRPESEWAPLFHRILTNSIRDSLRRRRVRSRWVLPWAAGRVDEDALPLPDTADPAGDALAGMEAEEAWQVLAAGLRSLPDRQREAFVLRALEGLDVAQSAEAMGCSEGSVKTHYFRAVQALRGRLEER
ncbi:MAG: RNA polymerase sigma factor [Steroidobacteraceae bacterium]